MILIVGIHGKTQYLYTGYDETEVVFFRFKKNVHDDRELYKNRPKKPYVHAPFE